MAPGRTIMGPQTYNALFTVHGVVMIFLFIIPGFPGAFGNLVMPIQIGARDVAFPRLNLFSWWLYIIGAVIILTSLFTGGGPPDTGWTFYVPFSARTGTNVSLAVFGVFIVGFSSILTGINFVTTIHRLRAEGMTWGRLPLFVWSLYATAWVQILATPILGITLVLVIAERVLGTGLFDPGTRRGSAHVPASVLDLFPPGGLHHDPAGDGGDFRDHSGLCPEADFRLQDDRLLQPRHRRGRFAGLGAPHVHQRHERHGNSGILLSHLHRGDPVCHQGLQLGFHPLQGVDLAGSADALRPQLSFSSSPSAGSRD